MTSIMSSLDFFVTTTKGLEDVLAAELHDLGLSNVTTGKGGADFSGSMIDAYRACLWLRTANRVLMPVKHFDCPSEDALYEGITAYAWEHHLTPDMTLAVDANVRDSAITHSHFAALKVKDAIVDRIRARSGRRPSVALKTPDLRINLHLVRNQCRVSLDLAGSGMHRRGYRRDTTVAPLKETLAAGLVALSSWDRQTHFVDPMCGSGTLSIEAAMMASNTAPGLLAPDFGFQRWLDFDKSGWQQLLDEAESVRKTLPSDLVSGSDRDRRAVDRARQNAKLAGLGGAIRWSCEEFARLTPPASSGCLICNPPYGERLGDQDTLESFYRKIGDTLKKQWAGWTGWVFTGNLPLAKRIGLKPSRRLVLFNGPIECRFLKFEMY